MMSSRHVPLQSSLVARPGRVVGRDEALALGKRLLALVREQSVGVFLEHYARAVITVQNGRVSEWHVGDELGIWFGSQFGSAWPLWIGTNQLDATSLQRVVAETRRLLPPPPETPPKENPDDPKYFTLNPREFVPVSLWHESTAGAMAAPAASGIPQALLDAMPTGNAGDADHFGSVVVSTRSTLYLYEPGLTAWAQETDSELTWSAYTPDGRVSAWAGQANRDVNALSPQHTATSAMELLAQSRDPVGLEPGRRTAILGPAAVAQLVRFMVQGFSGDSAEIGHSPFSEFLSDGRIRPRLGQRVFDERLRMMSDPADPDGGFPPFFELGNNHPGKVVGLPIPAVTWIEGGVLEQLSWGIFSYGRPWCELPYSVRLEAMPGTSTMTVDEMIADCDEGVYVNRLSGLEVIDQRSGMMTGTTRDGCFFVKDGKISKPVKNFRFVESPFHVLNRLLAIGAAERVALGIQDSTPTERHFAATQWPPRGRWTRWPRSPIIVPPLMVTDFNFSALAEAV